MKHEMNKLLINDFRGTNKMNTSRISITDLPVACELDREAQISIRGGRIMLDDDVVVKKGVDPTDGTGGEPLHSHIGNIWSAHFGER